MVMMTMTYKHLDEFIAHRPHEDPAHNQVPQEGVAQSGSAAGAHINTVVDVGAVGRLFRQQLGQRRRLGEQRRRRR